jgi:hypothetical protein
MVHAGEDKECIQNFGGKPLRKWQLRITRKRWEDNIKMDLREPGWEMEETSCVSCLRAFILVVLNLHILLLSSLN